MKEEAVKKSKLGWKIPKNNLQRGAIVQDYEVEMLKHIYIHKQMRATSLHALFKFIVNEERVGSNISNRFTKLVQANVLRRIQERIVDLSGNFVRYYYALGENGLKVLELNGIITKAEAFNYANSEGVNRIPLFHNKAASVMVNNLVIQCMKLNMKFDFCRGTTHRIFGNISSTIQQETTGLIIPDYIIENKQTIICIEIDTGTQRMHVINNKIKKYVKQSRESLIGKKKLIVLFMVVDGSISQELNEDRTRRIHSLKGNTSNFEDLPSNMEIYTVNAKQSVKLVPNILNSFNNLEDIEKDFICEDFMELYKEKYKHSFVQQAIPANRTVAFNGVFTFDDGLVEHHVYLLHRRLGSLSEFRLSEAALRYLEHRVTRNVKQTLLFIYDSSESALNDITGLYSDDITIAASYIPRKDEELVIYKNTAVLSKRAMKGLLHD